MLLSIANGFTIEKRAPDRSLFVEFTLRSPQILTSSATGMGFHFISIDTAIPTTVIQADMIFNH